jgi:hypothetical protein
MMQEYMITLSFKSILVWLYLLYILFFSHHHVAHFFSLFVRKIFICHGLSGYKKETLSKEPSPTADIHIGQEFEYEESARLHRRF